MSYKNDSEIVILNRYGKASGDAKAELFETYERLRDLTVAGPTMGGSGLGKFSSAVINLARMFGSSQFMPTFGSEAITIPGTSYFAPISGGNGITAGGQAAFGLAPWAQSSGFVGGAAPLSGGDGPISWFSRLGIGSASGEAADWMGIGDPSFPQEAAAIGGLPAGGRWMGGAGPLSGLGSGVGLVAGGSAGIGFGRNWVLPAAGLMSGIGGLLTTLGPFFGPFGLAGAAAGSLLNGVSGAVLASFQRISNQMLVNADTILSSKVRNLETVTKMLDAQQDVVKKLLKDSLDGDKKLLENV